MKVRTLRHFFIAQLARRRTTNLVVGGSSPAIGTMFHNAIGGTYWTIVIMSKELSGVIFSRNKALQSAVISPWNTGDKCRGPIHINIIIYCIIYCSIILNFYRKKFDQKISIEIRIIKTKVCVVFMLTSHIYIYIYLYI